MTDNHNDDFEQHDFNPTEELPPPKGMRANLSNAWQSRPGFKLIVLMMGVAAVVAAGVSFFSSGSSGPNASRFVTPPSINAPPGGPTSPYMQQQTNLANQNREQEALQTGGSALPTPIGQNPDSGALNNTKTDQLNELRAEVERMKQERKQTPQPGQPGAPGQPGQQQRPEQFDDSLAQAMQRQMSQLMDSWTPHGVKEVTVTKDDGTGASGNAGAGANGASGAQGQQAQSQAPAQQAKTIVPAGTVSYAQLLTEANSDVPGPILAQILSGPLAGARAVGQFQISSGYADYLVLQFTLVNFKGNDYPINAVALDPDTTLGGMATEVNQRYFTRVVLPAAAGFLQGFGQAIGEGNQSVVTNGTTTIVTQSNQGIHQGIYQGIGQAASTASQFFQNQANLVKPLVRVEAGTPMGMFFVASVMDTTLQQQQQQNANLQGVAGYGANGALGYPGFTAGSNPYANPSGYGATGYPGTTVAGYGNSSVPYPNYGTSQRTFSPYSAFPTTTYPSTGLGTTLYGH